MQSHTITTRRSTNKLVGQSLPQHNMHDNGLMKTKVMSIESGVVDKYAAASGSTATAALQFDILLKRLVNNDNLINTYAYICLYTFIKSVLTL